jgi:carboxyl-terminal processing protease
MKRISAILPAVLLISASALLGATRSPKQDIARNLDIFNAIYKTLQTTYVDTIDAEKSIKTAIDAMLADIDPYTEYYPEEDQEDLLSISSGEFGGIGAVISQDRQGRTRVSEPQNGTPAQRVGLKAGDIFWTIDGDTVITLGSAKVRERLRGQAGTPVKVVVKRPYAVDSMLQFDITRAKIEIQAVPYYGVVADSIGYIQLTTFNEKSPRDVRDALIDLKKNPRVKGLILDLRGNGGGLLESAVQIVGHFVAKGTEVLRTRGRGLVNEKIYKTTSTPIDVDIPLVVLIDGGSASSAEITAGALQDLDRAVVVGNRSYGKGLVQSTRQLPYNGMMKVTVAKYYIPSGRLIQAIDYSQRNADGSVSRIPDSLTNVFHTRIGRVVRDGGGITPDITVEYPDVNRLVYNIVSNQWDFDFATLYASQHPTIASPETFEVDDEIYEQFKQFIDPTKFEYDKVCETLMEQVEKSAKTEGYLNDTVQAQIDALKASLKHDLRKDLDTHRDQISRYLAEEILKRYYFSRGATIESLRHDNNIDRAVAILKAPKEYKSILSAPKK